jgi:glycosyltransferase involved in cell wall biosynthesis
MPDRILHVSSAGRIGGAERSLLQLLAGLDPDRYESHVALPGPGPLEQELRSLGVPVHCAPLVRLRRTAWPGRLAAQAVRTAASAICLARLAVRLDVRLIHAQDTSALPAAGPAARLAGVPCLWHVRDLRPGAPLTRLLAPLCDGAVCVSRAVRDATGLAGVGRPVWTVPNAIAADAFAGLARPGEARRELGLPPQTPVALVAAQMVPWKGHRRFLAAMALLRRTCPAVALLAGDDLFGDHPGYVAELRRLAERLGIAGAVRFLGHRRDVPTLMADADVVVVPSDAEPFGRVVLEAMALGRPVVGLARGGLPEVVQDGVTGRLVRGDSAEDLARAMAELLTDAATRERMGTAGRRLVRERFDLPAHAARISEVYGRLTRRRGASACGPG